MKKTTQRIDKPAGATKAEAVYYGGRYSHRVVYYGAKKDGVQLHYQGEGKDEYLDEIFMFRNGRCIFHLEAMSDQTYWMGIYGKTHDVHAWIGSENGRSHVGAKGEGWRNE